MNLCSTSFCTAVCPNSAAALCPVSLRWIFVSGVTSLISCPAPLYACSSSRIPLASFSTTSTCSHTSRSASVGWASAKDNHKVNRSDLIGIYCKPHPHWAKHTANSSSRNTIKSSNIIESLICNFQLCKWNLTKIISSFHCFQFSFDATHFPGWEEENGAR